MLQRNISTLVYDMVYTYPLLSRVPEWGPAFICLQLFTTPNTHAQIDWLQVFFFMLHWVVPRIHLWP